MIRPVKFILTVLRQSLIREMQFRTNFLANLFVSLLEGAMLAIFYSVMLEREITFQVWQARQVFFFVGTFLVIHNLFKTFLADGVGSLSELIRTGNLDGLLMCSSFWIVKTGELDSIFATAIEFGNKPYLIYPEWLQFTFSTVLTFFLAGNYQVMVVTGGLGWTDMFLMLVSLLLWSLLGRFLWNRGIRHYHGAGR